MLKLVAGLVAGATLLTVGTVSALAASHGNGFGSCSNTQVCDTTNCSAQCYVDADHDGVCDNFGTGSNGNGNGQNYVDADNDGVCDNQGTHCNGGGQGHHGNGYRGGHHG